MHVRPDAREQEAVAQAVLPDLLLHLGPHGAVPDPHEPGRGIPLHRPPDGLEPFQALVADVPQLLQILLYLGQWYFQLCDFAEKRFLLLLQLIFRFILIVRVLGKVVSGFLIPGNLRVFLFEFPLYFLKKYLLVLLIDSLTFLAVCPAGKNPVNHFAPGFLWLHLIAVICG